MNGGATQTGVRGGCQCGAIRYRLARPYDVSVCHCRMCQKAFGNFGAVLVCSDRAETEWTRGQPSEFRSSLIVARGFCPACGTPLYMAEDGEAYEMAVGTLDNPAAVGPPNRQSGVESRWDWIAGLGTLPQETTADYRSAADLARLASRQHPDHDTSLWPAGGRHD